MIAALLRQLADAIDPPRRTVDLTPYVPPAPGRCLNCGWDGKSDATPLLADLLEDARRDGARVHGRQEDTAHGSRRAS